MLATILAWGASFFGILVAVFLISSLRLFLIFLPGYILWVFYVTRWLAVPPLGVRYVGWLLSLIVQAAWLVWYFGGTGLPRSLVIDLFALSWWGGACLASIWALVYEHRVPTESDIPPVFRLPRDAYSPATADHTRRRT